MSSFRLLSTARATPRLGRSVKIMAYIPAYLYTHQSPIYNKSVRPHRWHTDRGVYPYVHPCGLRHLSIRGQSRISSSQAFITCVACSSVPQPIDTIMLSELSPVGLDSHMSTVLPLRTTAWGNPFVLVISLSCLIIVLVSFCVVVLTLLTCFLLTISIAFLFVIPYTR